jgi:hypothetical protein
MWHKPLTFIPLIGPNKGGKGIGRMLALRRRMCLMILMLFGLTHAAFGQAASAPEAAAPAPKQVVVGMYINDIQTIDLRTNAYGMDFYLWFRWKDPTLNPVEGFEFMNRFDPEAHVQTTLFEKPVPQPDGSLYQIVRHQGQFTTKFPLQKYPFDSQKLLITIEDAQQGAQSLQYVPDREGLQLNPEIKLPGYAMGAPKLVIRDKSYPTIFGDLSNPSIGAYSRADFIVPVQHPVLTGLFKAFIPVFLIILCAALALLLDPVHVEARIGLSITALLTLVAMQFTMLANLPDVSYLTLLDQLYLASYLYVLIVIAIIVGSTRIDDQGALRGEAGATSRIAKYGPLVAQASTGGYAVIVALICLFNLA